MKGVANTDHGRGFIDYRGRYIYRMAYDSVRDAIDDAALACIGKSHGSEAFLRGSNQEKGKWNGCCEAWPKVRKFNFDTIADLVYTKWDKGIKIVEEFERLIENDVVIKPSSRMRRRSWDESYGDNICIDRLRSGQDYWSKSVRVFVDSPMQVTIIIDMGGNSNRKLKDTLWRIAAATAVTRVLESAGYSVEVYCANRADGCYKTSGQTRSSMVFSVKLKDAGDAIDKSLMVNFCSVWCMRTIGFRLFAVPQLNTHWSEVMTIRETLGSHSSLDNSDVSFITPDSNVFLFDEVWSKKSSLKTAKDVLQSIDPISFEKQEEELRYG